MKNYYVYIIASESGTLYVGMTDNLQRRIYEHKKGLVEGFSKKYNCKKLIYYEEFNEINQTIAREKQIKHWRRSKKEFLIRSINPSWKDLSKKWK